MFHTPSSLAFFSCANAANHLLLIPEVQCAMSEYRSQINKSKLPSKGEQ